MTVGGPRRPLCRTERELLYLRAAGRCERCGEPISIDSFHAAHLRAASHGGPAILDNLQAWCVRCNYAQGANDVMDTRTPPRGWQLAALKNPDIPTMIARQGVATVAAAPGSGKTLFAAFVFERLREAGRVKRVAIFVPRRTLVEQWHDSWGRHRHLELRRHSALERQGQIGTICTYQSLTPEGVDAHQRMAQVGETLVIFDEVHHLGEPEGNGQRPAWARAAMQLVGEIGALRVSGVLNLSGTLWRSSRSERISSVRYEEIEGGRLQSIVDINVEARTLIRAGQLRPVDLYRRGATVELVDHAAATRVIGQIADFSDRYGRAALGELPNDAGWRESFVEAILERLERVHRDLDKAPMKGLIVARSQDDARRFQDTANRIMARRHLPAFTELAISDEPEAPATLARFKKSAQPGILCTVDMAGEGYDCPEIAVVGFATNKLTPLYVRQVVARGQRVTKREIEKLGRPLPCAVVIPDVPEIVEVMKNILEPMRHEVEAPDAGAPVRVAPTLTPALAVQRLTLGGVNDLSDGDAHITGTSDGDVEMGLIRRVEPHMREVGLPETETARAIYAIRKGMQEQRAAEPFDPLQPSDVAIATSNKESPTSSVRIVPLSIDETVKHRCDELAALGRWWFMARSKLEQSAHDFPTVEVFQGGCNAAGRITGKREDASPQQLADALAYARREVRRLCATKELPLPRVLRDQS